MHNIHYTPPTQSSLMQSKKHIPTTKRLFPSNAHSLLAFLIHCECHTFLSTFFSYLVHIDFPRIFLVKEVSPLKTRTLGQADVTYWPLNKLRWGGILQVILRDRAGCLCFPSSCPPPFPRLLPLTSGPLPCVC